MTRKANRKPEVMLLEIGDVAKFFTDAIAGKLPIGDFALVRDQPLLYQVTFDTTPGYRLVSGGAIDVVGLTGEDLSTAQYKFVKYNATKQLVLCDADGEPSAGVVQNVPLAAVNSFVTIRRGGVSLVKLGAGLNALDFIATDQNGLAQEAARTAVAGAAVTASYCMGQLLETGILNDLKAVDLGVGQGILPTTFA